MIGFFRQGSARYEFDLALPADPHRRGAAGLGATDEWRAPERFDESVACQPRVFHPDRSLPGMLKDIMPSDVVTVTRIDRLARSTFDLFAIVKRIVNTGGQIRSLA